jgi:hypothetical protein
MALDERFPVLCEGRTQDCVQSQRPTARRAAADVRFDGGSGLGVETAGGVIEQEQLGFRVFQDFSTLGKSALRSPTGQVPGS